MAEGILLTPYINGESSMRAHLKVSDSDYVKFTELPFGPSSESIIVHDLVSGLNVELKRADCGLNCYCAAVVVKEMEVV